MNGAATTEGTLLGGRVRYRQYAKGYRTGIEPVLLAACVPALGGERVIEAGSGAGAGLLCLAWRVPGLSGVGVEVDPALVNLARHNADANGVAQRLVFAAERIEAFRSAATFDHAMANPPWHDAASTGSPDAGRERAKRATAATLTEWFGALAGQLRHRGTLSAILPPAMLPAALAAVAASRCGSVQLTPLWSRAGRPAKLLIMTAVRGGAGPLRLQAGLVLHEADGGYTRAAASILTGSGGVEG